MAGMRPEVRPHHGLAELAAKQHGVVARDQLRALGYLDGAIGRQVRAGSLLRVHRGVYAVGHGRLSVHGQAMAAVLACGPRALPSHGSAAWLWGLLLTSPSPHHVTVPNRGHRRRSIRLHHATGLTGQDRATRDAIPVTSVPRTLLDLTTILPATRLHHTLELSERLELFDLRRFDALLARTHGHPGHGRLRSALASYREPAFTRSELERRLLKLVREAGLPRPSVNFFVAGCEIDVYWPRERFGVELDGFEFHRTRAAFERDRRRQEDLKLEGIEIIRLTSRRIEREPEQVANRLRVLLARRRAEVSA
jgi:very-short-patch-repair endonuclease